MAEGWARRLHGDKLHAYSAGVAPHGIDPRAVKVMAEAGIDIQNQKSQHIDEFADINLDLVITVCGHAHETCPVFPGTTKVVHQGFDDPPRLAKEETDETAALDHYRRVRDQIKAYISKMPESLDIK